MIIAAISRKVGRSSRIEPKVAAFPDRRGLIDRFDWKEVRTIPRLPEFIEPAKWFAEYYSRHVPELPSAWLE